MKIRAFFALLPLVLLGGRSLLAQNCEHLQNSTSDDLVSFLREAVPGRGNGDCLTFAIRTLGTKKYEPATPVLLKLLDFRRPSNSRERRGVYLHIQSVGEIYPAVAALEEIGKSSLPSVLQAIKERSTSAKARENAVAVWMQLYHDDSSAGVALLKRNADEARDLETKQHLLEAVSKAVIWCNPPDEQKCRKAAHMGYPD